MFLKSFSQFVGSHKTFEDENPFFRTIFGFTNPFKNTVLPILQTKWLKAMYMTTFRGFREEEDHRR